jgi:hypothetical protein
MPGPGGQAGQSFAPRRRRPAAGTGRSAYPERGAPSPAGRLAPAGHRRRLGCPAETSRSATVSIAAAPRRLVTPAGVGGRGPARRAGSAPSTASARIRLEKLLRASGPAGPARSDYAAEAAYASRRATRRAAPFPAGRGGTGASKTLGYLAPPASGPSAIRGGRVSTPPAPAAPDRSRSAALWPGRRAQEEDRRPQGATTSAC